MLSIRDPLVIQRHRQVEMKGWEKTFHANSDPNRVSGPTNTRQNRLEIKFARDKEGIIC